ncbi:MAG TPA: DUF177 domain-containing protein [Sphingomicrobium sp.]|jgi:uncharacterized metal-binding protein YceD (DUF177 family)|nr:DUF177 domain-containing protein [Sphingomicrobium sp.]
MDDRFAHGLALDRIRDGERIDLTADEAERQAVAKRLGLRSLDRLEAHVTLSREGPRIAASGRIRASLEQDCVATGEPIGEHVDEPFEIAFVRGPESPSPDEEIELNDEECDVVFYDGGTIDLGSAIADTLALVIDPYPRSSDADSALRDAGVMTEEQAGPFAALAALKKGGDEA